MNENVHRGSSFDDFLQEEGILDEVNETALERVIAWQLRERMRERGMTKTELAHRMNTSRSQVDRMLNGTEPGIGLGTLAGRASAGLRARGQAGIGWLCDVSIVATTSRSANAGACTEA